MSTLVILIDKNTPQHWDYAKRHGFRDMKNDWKDPGSGDTLCGRHLERVGTAVGRMRWACPRRSSASRMSRFWAGQVSVSSRRGLTEFQAALT